MITVDELPKGNTSSKLCMQTLTVDNFKYVGSLFLNSKICPANPAKI